jgi:hypothetical protein
LLLEEIDAALRPQVHERRVPSSGSILEPRNDPGGWAAGTALTLVRTSLGAGNLPRRFVDGLSSWLLRRTAGPDEWLLFDRPAGSERDLVVLAEVLGAVIVQRHPVGIVRVVGDFGVLRWQGLDWHHEPPVATWLDTVGGPDGAGAAEMEVLDALLRFAIHDLGSAGIGALLVYRPTADPGPPVEDPRPPPLELSIRSATHLAPLRHALGQVDGAAVFDGAGVLRRLGVRLVPSAAAERLVGALEGTRHTSALRYSYDDPVATVVVVSEDGPVSVLRGGAVLGRSAVWEGSPVI